MGLIYFFVYQLLNLRASFVATHSLHRAKRSVIVPNPDLALPVWRLSFISMIPIVIGSIGLVFTIILLVTVRGQAILKGGLIPIRPYGAGRFTQF